MISLSVNDSVRPTQNVPIDLSASIMNGTNGAPKLEPSAFAGKLYLNGSLVEAKSKATYNLRNPKDDSSVVDGIAIAGQEDVDIAVQHAEKAFRGPCSTFTSLQRTECLIKLAVLLEEHLVSILTLDSLTSGNPTSIIPTRERTYIKNCVLHYAGWTDKFKGDYLPADDGA